MPRPRRVRPARDLSLIRILWRLYQRRGRKGWNREIATRLGLASIFERFDEIRYGSVAGEPRDERSIVAALMLRSIAEGEGEGANSSNQMPQMFGTGIVNAAKAQLRLIVDCGPGAKYPRDGIL